MGTSSKRKRQNPGKLVTMVFCDERFGRILDKLDTIDEKVTNLKKEKREEAHFWRNLLGTILGGGVVALIAFLLQSAL